MLYDPKWNAQKIVSLENLIAWLEQQPPNKTYQFSEWSNCALAQWLRSLDPMAKSTPSALCDGKTGSGFIYTVFGEPIDLRNLQEIVRGERPWLSEEHTFGRALQRARRVLLG